MSALLILRAIMTGKSLSQPATPRKRPNDTSIEARRTALIGIDSITFPGQAAPVTSEFGLESAISTSVAQILVFPQSRCARRLSLLACPARSSRANRLEVVHGIAKHPPTRSGYASRRNLLEGIKAHSIETVHHTGSPASSLPQISRQVAAPGPERVPTLRIVAGPPADRSRDRHLQHRREMTHSPSSTEAE
jgi:hypothetical protein